MTRQQALDRIGRDVIGCRACPRLVAWREQVGRLKRRAYCEEAYWARPVPGFGDANSSLVVVGLAPAAHGANRTGRMFTGDSSGDFLCAALHRAGLASRPTSEWRGDGLALRGCFLTAAARCAPPRNRPEPRELARCAPFLERELAALRPRAVLALGSIAWEAVLGVYARAGARLPRPKPAFAHGAELRVDLDAASPVLLASYHVSRQNTQTGRLTTEMFDAILRRAAELAAA
ncbi:MAG TPA: uracil-DNA glycosylase [Anaeromyxobacteraceae bacterium]|nr:uracil-DNA glycosylase [Anaeromyxobacteraceae bacterium]